MSEPEFDIVSPPFHADPAFTLERIRASGRPFVSLRLPILGNMLLAVTHETCGAILKDKNAFVRDPANADSRTQERILKILPRSIGLLALNMLGKDDPEHRHLRGLVDQAFQRRGIEAMRPTITAAADRLLDGLTSHREVDLMENFCRDLPLAVICEMLGLPDQDHERFKSWLGGLQDTANIGAVIRAIPGVLRVGWLDQNADFDSLAISGAIAYKPTNDLKFTLSNDYGDRSPMRYLGTPLIDGAIPDKVRFTNFNAADAEIRYRDNWTQLKTEWTPSDWFSVRNVAYRLTSRRHWKESETFVYNDGTGLVDIADFLEIYHDQEQIGDRFDASLKTPLGNGVKNELVVGFDVNRIEFQHSNNYSGVGGGAQFDFLRSVDPFNFSPYSFINFNGSVPVFETTTNQYALFAEDRLELSKELSVIGGIRLDNIDVERDPLNGRPTNLPFEKSFSETTWRVGAVYSPIRDLAFYGQYATAVDPIGSLLSLSLSSSQWQLATGRQIEVGV